MTWQAGPADELTWRAGSPRGCDVALRPRSRATSGTCEGQVAHRARTHGKGHACPRGFTRTPVRRHVARGGRRVKGPRDSGPW